VAHGQTYPWITWAVRNWPRTCSGRPKQRESCDGTR
jgi:hypothetical protein